MPRAGQLIQKAPRHPQALLRGARSVPSSLHKLVQLEFFSRGMKRLESETQGRPQFSPHVFSSDPEFERGSDKITVVLSHGESKSCPFKKPRHSVLEYPISNSKRAGEEIVEDI